MGASEYVLNLRKKIGNDLIVLPSAMCVIRDDTGAVLLMQHATEFRWMLPGGAVEPGEDAATAARREVLEETGLEVELTGIAGVFGGEEFTEVYQNGDRVSYVATAFYARARGGTLQAVDGEALDFRYASAAEMSGIKMGRGSRRVIETCLASSDGQPYFRKE